MSDHVVDTSTPPQARDVRCPRCNRMAARALPGSVLFVKCQGCRLTYTWPHP